MANNFTLAEATALRAAAFSAYQKALAAAEYKIGTREVRNQNIDALWRQFDKWDRVVSSLNGESPIVRKRIVPNSCP